MPNMDYCRFENTLSDLQECIADLEHRNYKLDGRNREGGHLSRREQSAALEILILARELAEQYNDQLDDFDCGKGELADLNCYA